MTVSYTRGAVRFRREVFASPVDQVIVVRLTADRPGSISFKAQLRGVRNDAHSNYGTEYFRMDGYGSDGLVLAGRSADYLGIAGRLRYEARLKVVPEGGRMRVHEEDLFVEGADAATLYVAAATSFVNFKDVSGDPHARVGSALGGLSGQVLCGDPRGPRPGASESLPARFDLSAGDGELAASDRRASQGVRRRQRPRSGGAVLPVRALPADLLVASRHATGEPPGHLEPVPEPAVGLEVHDQHQPADELLARRSGESRRVHGAARPDDPRS